MFAEVFGLDRLATWSRVRWAAAILSFAVLFLVVGLQTALIPSPLAIRMVPPSWWMWPLLICAVALAALLIASFVDTQTARGGWLGIPGGFLALLAVSCPSCNMIAVALVGRDGALRWWAPAQPAVGMLALVLLGYAVRTRLLLDPAPPVRRRG